jgi:hypothetical protein
MKRRFFSSPPPPSRVKATRVNQWQGTLSDLDDIRHAPEEQVSRLAAVKLAFYSVCDRYHIFPHNVWVQDDGHRCQVVVDITLGRLRQVVAVPVSDRTHPARSFAARFEKAIQAAMWSPRQP